MVITEVNARRVLFVMLTVVATAVGVRAQNPALTLSVDDGTTERPVARLLKGEWVAAAACVPDQSPAALPDGRARLIVTGGAAPQMLQPLTPGDLDWVRLMPFILRLFDQRERQERLTQRTTAAHTAVDFIYRTDAGTGRTYYFEASRRIASPDDVDVDTDPPGTLRLSVAGFLRDATGGPASIGTKSELRWEQDGRPVGPGRPDLAPLGVLHEGKRSLWVMKGQSGATMWYTIYEVTSQSVRTLLTVRPPRC